MYQATTIDTSQIVPVNFSAASNSLPEVTVSGVVAKLPQETVPTSPATIPLTTSPTDVFTTKAEQLNPASTWPDVNQMLVEMTESGMLNPELGMALPVTPPTQAVTLGDGTVAPIPELPAPIPLANTGVTFVKPSAELLLHSEESHHTQIGKILMILIGLALIVMIGFMYFNLVNQGMSSDEIMETTMDSIAP